MGVMVILPAMRPAAARVAARERFRHPVPETRPAVPSPGAAGVVCELRNSSYGCRGDYGIATVWALLSPGVPFSLTALTR